MQNAIAELKNKKGQLELRICRMDIQIAELMEEINEIKAYQQADTELLNDIVILLDKVDPQVDDRNK